jgi:hypothetical protein
MQDAESKNGSRDFRIEQRDGEYTANPQRIAIRKGNLHFIYKQEADRNAQGCNRCSENSRR